MIIKTLPLCYNFGITVTSIIPLSHNKGHLLQLFMYSTPTYLANMVTFVKFFHSIHFCS